MWRNTLTYIGTWIAGVSLLFILSLLWIDLITPRPNPYLGVFTFLLLPGLVIVGLTLMIAGLIIKRRQMRRRFGPLSPLRVYPRLDFNVPAQRRVLAAAVAVSIVSVIFVATMSYHGYHYTDSNEFCGGVCHTVMAPQYVAHEHSAHARVDCAACHIGNGASWYVKSKLSGLRQVLAVASDSYPRPIPPAIRELRPAAETCEQCHWPEKFYGDQLLTKHRFANDENSTPRTVRMLVKTGGSDPRAGPTSGIHWHMALGQKIEFIATDDALQDIPWVKSVDRNSGTVRVYRSDGLKSSDAPPAGTHRVMDCMDCHNRATHVFHSPADAADKVLNAKPELRALPFAKRQLVASVMREYDADGEGAVHAADDLKAYYEKQYPDLDERQRTALATLAATAREIYRSNVFPGMRVDWKSYPNNIGHLESAGCFRCHDGRHVDDNGRPVTSACDTCHEFLVPHEEGAESLVRTNAFVHPVELPGVHATLECRRCHSGGVLPEATCEGCHADVTAFRAGATPELASFGIEADAMAEIVGCEDCHDVGEPMRLATVSATCTNCHDETYGTMPKTWKSEIGKKLAGVKPRDARTRAILEKLRAAGPLHNPDAARKVLDALAGPGAT